MNNEEAIEYLKNLIKNPTISQDPFYTTKIAIDTVLDYIEELEKKNKDLCENYCPKYKELENKLETQTQNYHSAMEDVNYFCGNYIPKQKIRDKIEDLKSYKGLVMYEKYNYDAIIRHLEELLEKGDK